MAHLLAALQQQVEAGSSGRSSPLIQNEDQQLQQLQQLQKLLAARNSGMGNMLDTATDKQPFNAMQRSSRLANSFTMRTTDQTRGVNSSDYVNYYYENKNLNPRLASPWLDGGDTDSQMSGRDSPSGLHAKLQMANGSVGGHSASLAELASARHHSFTAGHTNANNSWVGSRPASLSHSRDLSSVVHGSQLDALVQSLSPKTLSNNGAANSMPSNMSVGGGLPNGMNHPALEALIANSGAGGSCNLSPRSSVNSMAPPMMDNGMLVGSPARNSPLSQSFTLGSKDVRLGMMGNSFGPGGPKFRAGPSKLRVGSTADDVPYGDPGTPGRLAGMQKPVTGLADALNNLQLGGVNASDLIQQSTDQTLQQVANTLQQVVAGMNQNGDGSGSNHAALLRDAAAAAAASNVGTDVMDQQGMLQNDQDLQTQYLQAAVSNMYQAANGSNPGMQNRAANMNFMQQQGFNAGPAGQPMMNQFDPMLGGGMGGPDYTAFYQNQALMAAAGMGGVAPNVPSGIHYGMNMGNMDHASGFSNAGLPMNMLAGLDANQLAALAASRKPAGMPGVPQYGPDLAAMQQFAAALDPATVAMQQLAMGMRSMTGKGVDTALTGLRGSHVLEEFKANKTRVYQLSDLTGHICEFSLDQHGSRFLQQKLETSTPEEMGLVLLEVQSRITHLMTDVFGNYVVQKLLEFGTPEQCMQLASSVHGQVLALSLQMYGCRVVQKALEVLPVDEQCRLVAELDGNVMRCVRDQNGNHVIQKVIECVPTSRITALLDNFTGCVVQLSSHPFGCRIIQRILEHCKDKDRRDAVMRDILSNAYQLSHDQYGNYVIQHVLEHGAPHDRATIAGLLTPHATSLSTHKFASNVVEKALVHCAYKERDAMIRAIIGPEPEVLPGSVDGTSTPDGTGEPNGATPGPVDKLQSMMHDQYGNYVVQKVLEVCDDNQRETLLARVRAQLHLLKKYTYGKHIVARVEKLLSTGTKIQTHLRARPLPNDTQTLSSLVNPNSHSHLSTGSFDSVHTLQSHISTGATAVVTAVPSIDAEKILASCPVGPMDGHTATYADMQVKGALAESSVLNAEISAVAGGDMSGERSAAQVPPVPTLAAPTAARPSDGTSVTAVAMHPH